MKVTLPLMELEAAHGDLEEFMRSCLRELSLQTESQELIGALSEAGQSCQLGARAGPSSGACGGRGVSVSHNRTRGPNIPRS